MAFDWSKVGAAPAAEEFEISIFGPGFGECVVIHAGQGSWAIVDSCIDSQSKDRLPVAERYLREIGANLSRDVALIVATHWHDDHIRGLSRLVDQCRTATFSCANSLLKQEFLEFAEEMGTASAATEGAKLVEFRAAIRLIHERKGVCRWAQGGRRLHTWSFPFQWRPKCDVRALSPSDREYDLFLQEVAAERPTQTKPKRSAAARTPNLASVVLHVQSGPVAVLLGSDMEAHHDPKRGWSAAVTEGVEALAPRASLFKVPHHGSVTGHQDQIWNALLVPRPISIVTPFNRGHKLPTPEDLDRLLALSGRLYLTAPTSRSSSERREAAVERSLRESKIVIRDRASPLGMVRSRTQDGIAWTTEAFPPAITLHAPTQ